MHLLALPDEILGLIAAACRDAAFCALRRTCCGTARLSFDDYALAAIARVRDRPRLLLLLHALAREAVRGRRRAVLDALIDAGGSELVVEASARAGDPVLFEWFPETADQNLSEVAEAAAKYGQIALLSKALRRCRKLKFDLDPDTLGAIAARNGQRAVLEYLRAHYTKQFYFTAEIVSDAVLSGSEPVLEFIARNPAGMAELAHVDRGSLIDAGNLGHLCALEWLARHGLARRIKKYAEEIAQGAARGDQVAVLEWIVEFGEMPTEYVTLLQYSAGRVGALRALKWVAAYMGTPVEERAVLAGMAAKRGSVSMLDWLAEKGLDEDEFQLFAIEQAARKGRREVLEWGRARFGYPRAVFACHAGTHEATDAFLAAWPAQ